MTAPDYEALAERWRMTAGSMPTSMAGYATDLRSVGDELAAALRALVKERDEAMVALERLGSSEAFDISRAIDAERDRELLMRMNYARAIRSNERQQAVDQGEG